MQLNCVLCLLSRSIGCVEDDYESDPFDLLIILSSIRFYICLLLNFLLYLSPESGYGKRSLDIRSFHPVLLSFDLS